MASIQASMDMTIYLYVRSAEKCLWYVIEETKEMKKKMKKKRKAKCRKAAPLKRPKITTTTQEEESESESEDGIHMVHRSGNGSQTDRIRKFHLPEITDRIRKFHFPELDENVTVTGSSLVALNSRLYLIGGVDVDLRKPVNGYYYLDIDKQQPKSCSWWKWQRRGGFKPNYQYGGATVCPDGLIYTAGASILSYHPFDKNRRSMKLPDINHNKYRGGHRLLGSTESKLYVYTYRTGRDFSNTMLSYDFKSRQWNVLLDNNFWGHWCQGAVLYCGHYGDDNDAYLFSFGTRNPKRQQEEGLPAVYAFHLGTLEWMNEPVAGLSNDGKVLPDLRASQHFYTRSLFTVGIMHDDDDHHMKKLKLALVWSRRYAEYSTEPNKYGVEVHWSKFIFNYTTSTTQPHLANFHAKLLSNGVCRLENGTLLLLNCAAQVIIGPRKGTEGVDLLEEEEAG